MILNLRDWRTGTQYVNKFSNLKKWLTLPEAAKRLSTVFEEEVTEPDLLRLALDGGLKLSVYFVNNVRARCGSVVPVEQAKYREVSEWVKEAVPGLKGKPVEIPVGLAITDETVVEFDEALHTLNGLYDLPMIGAEVLDVEHWCQMRTGGPAVTMMNLEGPFVETSDGKLCQLLEFSGGMSKNELRYDDLNSYHPAPALPKDAVLAVRPSELIKIEQRAAVSASTLDGWEGFDPDDPKYPEELDIALQAWSAVRAKQGTTPVKDQLTAWLKQSGYKLSSAAVERIATICNWDRAGGRPKLN